MHTTYVPYLSTVNMYTTHCTYSKHVHNILSLQQTCTQHTVLTVNMYTTHCPYSKHVHNIPYLQ